MLVIKDLADLKRYLETRREMAEKQKHALQHGGVYASQAMVYAFDEAIKAVDALLNYHHREEELE